MKAHLNCFQKVAENERGETSGQNSSAKPISVATNIYKGLQDIKKRAVIKIDKAHKMLKLIDGPDMENQNKNEWTSNGWNVFCPHVTNVPYLDSK